MEAPVNYLLRILNVEIQHAERIFLLLKEKEEVLIHNDVKMFFEIVKREHEYFVKSKELEESRKAVVEVIAKKLGISIEKITLQLLAQKLHKQFSSLILNIREKLKEILLKIERQNKKCELLIKKTREIIAYSIELLAGKNRFLEKRIYNRKSTRENHIPLKTFIDHKG